MDGGEYPFASDLFFRHQVESALDDCVGRAWRVSPRELDVALKAVGAERLKQTRIWGRKVRVWALRNHEQWKIATPAEVEAELNRGGHVRFPL